MTRTKLPSKMSGTNFIICKLTDELIQREHTRRDTAKHRFHPRVSRTSANFAPRHQAYVISIKLVWNVSTYSFTSMSICKKSQHTFSGLLSKFLKGERTNANSRHRTRTLHSCIVVPTFLAISVSARSGPCRSSLSKTRPVAKLSLEGTTQKAGNVTCNI